MRDIFSTSVSFGIRAGKESGSRKTNALSGYDVIPRFIVFLLLVIGGGPRLFISLKVRVARKPEKAARREREREREREER